VVGVLHSSRVHGYHSAGDSVMLAVESSSSRWPFAVAVAAVQELVDYWIDHLKIHSYLRPLEKVVNCIRWAVVVGSHYWQENCRSSVLGSSLGNKAVGPYTKDFARMWVQAFVVHCS
jgi:hypothetical protein